MSKTTQGLVRMLCVGMFADICCLFRTKALVLTREKLILINNYNSTVRHEWVIMKGRDGSVYVVISWYFCCSVLRINRGGKKQKQNKNLVQTCNCSLLTIEEKHRSPGWWFGCAAICAGNWTHSCWVGRSRETGREWSTGCWETLKGGRGENNRGDKQREWTVGNE